MHTHAQINQQLYTCCQLAYSYYITSYTQYSILFTYFQCLVVPWPLNYSYQNARVNNIQRSSQNIKNIKNIRILLTLDIINYNYSSEMSHIQIIVTATLLVQLNYSYTKQLQLSSIYIVSYGQTNNFYRALSLAVETPVKIRSGIAMVHRLDLFLTPTIFFG